MVVGRLIDVEGNFKYELLRKVKIFLVYISLKEVILERLKILNKNKVEYGLFILIFFNLFVNKVKNVWKCIQFNKYLNMLLYKNVIKK